MKRPGVFLLPQDRMLVHYGSLPQNFKFPQQFASTDLYFWVERGTVRVKCLAQELNTVSTTRAQTRTTCSRDEHTNHEATVPNLYKYGFKKTYGFYLICVVFCTTLWWGHWLRQLDQRDPSKRSSSNKNSHHCSWLLTACIFRHYM